MRYKNSYIIFIGIVLVVFILCSVSALADDFEIDLSRIYYQDGSGREIDDNFSQDTIDVEGVITISDSAVIQRPLSEAGTTYVWEPVEGDTLGNVLSQLNPGGPAVMSIPGADNTIPSILTANITVDGNTADWASMDPHITDINSLYDDCSVEGSDIDYIKLAYNEDKTRLYILIKTNASNVSTNLWYRLFFDNDIDGNVGEPGDCQVDFQYLGAVWDVVSQGWNSDDGWDWYPIDEQGEVAVSGYFIEGSVDISSLGLPDDFHLFGRTMYGGSPYNSFDHFDALKLEVEGTCALGGIDVAAPASETWQFQVRINNFRNVNLDQDQHYYDVGIGGGTNAEVYENTETQVVALGTITVDGNGADWVGLTPALVDPQGDSTGGSGADIKHIYTAIDDTYVYIMVETYNTPINSIADIEINFNYKDGQYVTHGVYDDLHINIFNSTLSAWNDNDLDGNIEAYPITGYTVARGDVMEARIPLSQIESAAYFNPTFINIWASGSPNGDDPSWVDPVITPNIWATWFTGNYEGTYFDHALVLTACIEKRGDEEDGWESEIIVLEGYDPSTTTIDLKLEIQNGNNMTGSYQINDGGWNQIAQHTIIGNMLSFAELYPYVNIETGIEPGSTGSIGDELAIDFKTLGIYVYNTGSWNRIYKGIDPDRLCSFGTNLAVDFGTTYGLYVYDAGVWTRVYKGVTIEKMAGFGDKLAIDFGTTYPIYEYNFTTDTWSQIYKYSSPRDTIEALGDKLVVDFKAAGIYVYDAGSWNRIYKGIDPVNIVSFGDKLAIDFGIAYGLYVYEYDTDNWTRIYKGVEIEKMAEIDGDLVVDFGTAHGLYVYEFDTDNWTRVYKGVEIEKMAGFDGNLAVDFGISYPIYEYDFGTDNWNSIYNYSAPRDELVPANILD